MKHLSAWACVCVCASACGSESPMAPTPPVTPPPVARVTLSGRVTATNGGQPMAGLAVILNGVTSVTDGSGSYALSLTAGSAGPITISGAGVVTRVVRVSVNNPHDLPVSVFGPGFDLAFYRNFARDGLTGTLQPIRHWTQAPKIYLKTVDEAGQPIDAVTLDTAAAALINTAGIWSGQTFGLAAMEQGTSTREGVSGWITVKWPNPPELDNCGRAQVGSDGGWIQLNYKYVPTPGFSSCACGASKIRPLTVRHELGHAFGYYHTGQAADVMSGLSVADCDRVPTAREQEYARYVYSRPVGNTDPDADSAASVQTFSPRLFVD